MRPCLLLLGWAPSASRQERLVRLRGALTEKQHLLGEPLAHGVPPCLDHSGHEEDVDDDPDPEDDQEDDANDEDERKPAQDAEEELCYGGAGASEIKAMGAEATEEDQQE